MKAHRRHHTRCRRHPVAGSRLVPPVVVFLFALTSLPGIDTSKAAPPDPIELDREYRSDVRPLLNRYCLDCHSAAEKSGDLDLERFTSIDAARKSLKPWQAMIEQLEAGQMPPEDHPRPSDEERARIVRWAKRFLEAEVRARAGDPGRVPLRRLSNAEYDRSVRDLTGVDLRPAREFPADGAAGEGFTNAAEALNMSPAMMAKYLNAAKEIAAHAVLLPDGFRFSPRSTRRDWTDESLAELRAFYGRYVSDQQGQLPLEPYLAALLRHRGDLSTEEAIREEAIREVARQERLHAKYLTTLHDALNDTSSGYPLNRLRRLWNEEGRKDVGPLVAEVNSWREPLWRFVPIGSYRDDNTVRQLPKRPEVVASRTIRFKRRPLPGQNDIVVYLTARDLLSDDGSARVVWKRPRFEAEGRASLLLEDYPKYGGRYEFDYPTLFADTASYLRAAVRIVNDPSLDPEEVAAESNLKPDWLRRWADVAAPSPWRTDSPSTAKHGTPIPTTELRLLGKPTENAQKPSIKGWRSDDGELPTVVSNASDSTEHVPGRMPPHKVTAHPTPSQFVAVVWTSPAETRIRVQAEIADAHPACGNGVSFRLEYRRGDQSYRLDRGDIELGGKSTPDSRELSIAVGDRIVLAVDARDANHVCDLTQIDLTITDLERPDRVWDLAGDVADTIRQGNPHRDRTGIEGVWSFAQGASQPSGRVEYQVPDESLLAHWREAAGDAARRDEAEDLAERLRRLLRGPQPADGRDPDGILYDLLTALDGPLLRGFEPGTLSRSPSRDSSELDYGSPTNLRPSDAGGHTTIAGEAARLRLPAALLRDHELVVDVEIGPDAERSALLVEVLDDAPRSEDVQPVRHWDGTTPILAAADGPGRRRLLAGLDRYRSLFPPFICYPHVIPLDEVVCLKTFHREDEPLVRLFLDERETRRIDRLWAEHRFITRFPVVENDYLPLFIGFVTQDQPKQLVEFYEGKRDEFRDRARRFEQEFESAAPRQLEQLASFAARAYRRPLTPTQRSELVSLYEQLRTKGMPHDEAFRNVLARVLVSPSFLLRLERAPEGVEPQPVDDWELASRLSYFLWSSLPDDELRRHAEAERLRDPETLVAQVRRMLQDDRIRGLAVEFGTQWIHVKDFDQYRDKNEKLFPEFDDELRSAINEESILFFEDLFRQDRPVSWILDADRTYLNERLARHYGIPEVSGSEWRGVDGVRKYGRGGILGLAGVQAKQSGASRTSPVLRGNWVVETLLGEKLPRPPPDVPQLPESETGNDGLTMRQLVEQHARVPRCAVCHQRIDPFGFALERYDPIGRLRDTDLGGLPVDSRVQLKDGTRFEGIDGLRRYLLTEKKDVFRKLFCRRLLGYALGREVTVSDTPLIDRMVAELDAADGRVSAAVTTIVLSKQFRMIRGRDFVDFE